MVISSTRGSYVQLLKKKVSGQQIYLKQYYEFALSSIHVQLNNINNYNIDNVNNSNNNNINNTIVNFSHLVK